MLTISYIIVKLIAAARWLKTNRQYAIAFAVLIALIFLLLFCVKSCAPSVQFDEKKVQEQQKQVEIEETQKLTNTLTESRKVEAEIDNTVKQAQANTNNARKRNANNATAQEIEKLAREK